MCDFLVQHKLQCRHCSNGFYMDHTELFKSTSEIFSQLIMKEADDADVWTRFILLYALQYLHGKPLPDVNLEFITTLFEKRNKSQIDSTGVIKEATLHSNEKCSEGNVLADSKIPFLKQNLDCEDIMIERKNTHESHLLKSFKTVHEKNPRVSEELPFFNTKPDLLSQFELNNDEICKPVLDDNCNKTEDSNKFNFNQEKLLNLKNPEVKMNLQTQSEYSQTKIQGIDTVVTFYQKPHITKHDFQYSYRRYEKLENLIPIDDLFETPERSSNMYTTSGKPLFHGRSLVKKDDDFVLIPMFPTTKVNDPRFFVGSDLIQENNTNSLSSFDSTTSTINY